MPQLSDFARGRGIVLYLATGGDMDTAIDLYGPDRLMRYVRRYRDGGRRPSRPWLAQWRGPSDHMMAAACARHAMLDIARAAMASAHTATPLNA